MKDRESKTHLTISLKKETPWSRGGGLVGASEFVLEMSKSPFSEEDDVDIGDNMCDVYSNNLFDIDKRIRARKSASPS